MMSSLPPGIHLSPNERLLCSHAIEYTDRMGTAFLTTLRMIVRVEQSSDARKAAIAQGKIQPTSEDNQPVQFTLPLANVTDHKVSAGTNLSKVMLKISYIGHANMASHVVLRFASNSPIEDRAQWKEVLSEIRAATVATETVVKNEPGIAPASASSSSSIAAPSSSSAVSASATSASSVLPRSASAAPFTTTTTTTAGGGGVKRTHQTMAATGSAASASAAGHVFAASSTTSPAVVVANNNNTALTSADQQALMKCRAAILARDKETAATHADLVPSTLSEDEFWSQREDMLRQEQTRLGVSINGGTRSSGMSVQQQAGVSSAMAANIRPDTSGSSNIVRFSLDATQIHSIFLEYPMVYELYQQLVPHTLDEKTFWTKFFKSQYENNQNESGGQTTTSNVTSRVDSFGPSSSLVPHDDDLFSRARQMQDARDHATINATGSTSVQSTGTYNNMVPPAVGSEAALAEQARDTGTKSLLLSRRIDPSVDLTAADFTDAVLLADPTLLSDDAPLSSTSARNSSSSKRARAQTELVQRFNRHGMLVLDSGQMLGRTHHSSTRLQSTPGEQSIQSTYHAQLASSLEFADLERTPPPAYNEIHVIMPRGGFQNAARKTTAVTSSSVQATVLLKQQRHAAAIAFRNALNVLGIQHDASSSGAVVVKLQQQQQQQQQQSSYVPSSDVARMLLLELSAQARGMNKAAIAAAQLTKEEQGHTQLMIFSTGTEADTPIPLQFRDELKKRYLTCTELFRHFWTSLNTRSSAKLSRVSAALDEQHRLLLLIRNDLQQRVFAPLVPLLHPLLESIELCKETYAKWLEREAKRAATANATATGAAANRRTVAAANSATNNASMIKAQASSHHNVTPIDSTAAAVLDKSIQLMTDVQHADKRIKVE